MPTNSEGPLASASADPLSDLWRKLSRPAAYSRHLPTLELGAYDAEDALAHDACFHASDSALDDEDVRSLGLALTKAAPASLKSIHLGGNALRGGSLAALLAALPAAPALETLWLADNELDGAAMAAFAMCTGNGGGGGALKHLSLQRNRVGDDGAASLAAALAGGALPALELLYLGENEVGDAGATALAEALREGACPKLRRLGLQANRLGDGALEALAAALRAGAMKGGALQPLPPPSPSPPNTPKRASPKPPASHSAASALAATGATILFPTSADTLSAQASFCTWAATPSPRRARRATRCASRCEAARCSATLAGLRRRRRASSSRLPTATQGRGERMTAGQVSTERVPKWAIYCRASFFQKT